MPEVVAAPAAPAATTTITTTARRSWPADFAARMTSGLATTTPVDASKTTHLKAAGSIFGDYLVDGVGGALFGAAHAKGMLDVGKAAVDGIVGLFAGGFSIALAPYFPTMAKYAARVGNLGMTTWSFRKGFELVSGAPLKPKTTTTVAGEDPIVEAGKDL